MPQVDIREIDNTSAAAVEIDETIVWVPITSIVEAVYDDISTFEAAVTTLSIDTTKQGYKIARYAILSGLKVLAVPYAKDMDLSKYEDKGIYDIRFMTLGDGLDESSDSDIQSFAVKVITSAAKRGNTTALVDISKANTDTAVKASAWANGLAGITVNRAPDTYTGKVISENGYAYASFFSPWVKFNDPETSTYLTNAVPGSIIYLNCFATYSHIYPDWFAMAGSVRGVPTFAKVTPEYKYGDADVAVLQKRTFGNESGASFYRAVNPICPVRPYGNIVWGNRTGYPLTAAEPGLKASSFLNIRQLCCDIKNVLYRASRKYTFEPNSDILWANFTSAIKPLLEDMRSNQGILGYKITKEKTLQKATLKARIRIIPIEAVEDFDLTVEMTDSIVEVNE